MSNYRVEERRVILAIRACKTKEQLDYAFSMRVELMRRNPPSLFDVIGGREDKSFNVWHEQYRKITK